MQNFPHAHAVVGSIVEKPKSLKPVRSVGQFGQLARHVKVKVFVFCCLSWERKVGWATREGSSICML